MTGETLRYESLERGFAGDGAGAIFSEGVGTLKGISGFVLSDGEGAVGLVGPVAGVAVFLYSINCLSHLT